MGDVSNDPEVTVPDSAPIAVFTALAWESAAVRAVLRRVRREGERVWQGSAGKRAVLVVTGGIGPRRTQQTLEQFADTPLAAVLSVGCAGALIPGLTAGQLVLAPDVRMLSTKPQAGLDHFPIDTCLLAYTRTAASRAAIPSAEGPLFTSAKILFTPEEKARQGRATGAIAVEMESGVHAAFATARGLPFLALRVILDPIGMALPAIKDLTTPGGDIRPFKAFAHLAAHPQLFPVLFALRRSQTAAAQTLTRLCRAFFPLLSQQR
jgi:adenosylhomocysteine nucleosidase